MPPSAQIEEMLLNIDNFGNESLNILYVILGVDKIKEEEKADEFFWNNIGQVVCNWNNATAGQRDLVCEKLVNRKLGRSQSINSNITRACNRILGLTSRRSHSNGKPILPEQVTETLRALYNESKPEEIEVNLADLFPGLKDDPLAEQ